MVASRSSRPVTGAAAADPRFRRCPTRRSNGFTLVELMIVVLIISLLCAIAVPGFAALQRRSRSAAVASDFRVFAAAFQAYAQETGAWPKEAAVGLIPNEMVGRIPAASWTRRTPIGGKYNWENNRRHQGQRIRAAITIAADKDAPLPLDVRQLLDLDRTLDDGDLFKGVFRVGTADVPLFILEP